jgi:GNAT superfamily N-acetyltransferase
MSNDLRRWMRLVEAAGPAAVTYEVIEQPPRLIIKQYVNGEYCGRICLKQNGNDLNVVSSDVVDHFQGRGYGKLLYLEAIRQASAKGCKMTSDYGISDSAVRVWRALSRGGIKVVANKAVYRNEDGLLSSSNDRPVFWVA